MNKWKKYFTPGRLVTWGLAIGIVFTIVIVFSFALATVGIWWPY